MTVEATTVVSFNSSSDTEDYIFNIELDDTRNLDSEGEVKTSFAPGDKVYLFVHKSFNVDVTDVLVTAGSISRIAGSEGGPDYRSGESTNLFATKEEPKEGEETPGKYTLDVASDICNVSYIGKEGRVTREVSNLGVFSYSPNINNTPFIAKFNYVYTGKGYLVTPPPMTLAEDETFPLAVVFYITVNEV